MGTFHVTHPDGTEWEIEAPDANAAGEALHSVRPVTWGDTAADTYKSLGTGIVEGVKGFLPGLQHGAESLKNVYREGLGIPQQPVPPSPRETQAATDQQFGLHQPQTVPGQYGQRAGQFIGNPASYIGPGGLAAKALMAGTSGVGSKAGEDLAKTTNMVSPEVGSFLGAALGGAAPSAGMRAVTPFASTAEHARDIAALQRRGVEGLTAGDITGNKNLRAAESELSPEANQDVQRSARQAAFRVVGEDITDIPITGNDGAIDRMMHRVGHRFDALSARNSADLDGQLISDLHNIHHTYTGVPGLYPQETVNTVNGAVNRVIDSMQHRGNLSGHEYQDLRSNLRAAAQGSSDPQRSQALHSVTNALDDAMERTIQRTNPADAGEWALARQQYRDALVLQRWGKSKNLTPDALAQSAQAIYGPEAYVRGRDNFSELADAWRKAAPEYPSSETSRRTWVRNIATHGPAAVGYVLGAHQGSPDIGVYSGLAGEAAGQLFGAPLSRRVLMSSPTQGYLGNQLLSRETQEAASQPLSVRLARALAQTQGQ